MCVQDQDLQVVEDSISRAVSPAPSAPSAVGTGFFLPLNSREPLNQMQRLPRSRPVIRRPRESQPCRAPADDTESAKSYSASDAEQEECATPPRTVAVMRPRAESPTYHCSQVKAATESPAVLTTTSAHPASAGGSPTVSPGNTADTRGDSCRSSGGAIDGACILPMEPNMSSKSVVFLGRNQFDSSLTQPALHPRSNASSGTVYLCYPIAAAMTYPMLMYSGMQCWIL
jgi:hypothetical protein